uniref:Uncharacterized protein n=1 Tax=viral metagenome TaxID=1070528 RepID=A0A6M3LBJ7_9ZZZZ
MNDNVDSVVLRRVAETPEILEVGRKAVEDVLVDFRDSCISLPLQGNGFAIRDKEGKAVGVLIRLGTADGLRIALKAIADHLAENVSNDVSEGSEPVAEAEGDIS